MHFGQLNVQIEIYQTQICLSWQQHKHSHREIILCVWSPYHSLQCGEQKCNKQIDTDHSRGKNDQFWLLCDAYVKQNIIKAELRKAKFQSINICRLLKNKKCNRRSMRKTDSNFDFFQAVKCSWSVKKKE